MGIAGGVVSGGCFVRAAAVGGFKLEDYQQRRLLVYFGRDFIARFAGAHEGGAGTRGANSGTIPIKVRQALISVGSGGLRAKAGGRARRMRLGFCRRAAAHNDFIFSVIAEEKGFVGSVIVLTLYAVVLFTGIRIAGQARDRLGKLLAVGVVTLLFSHVFINIGMNIRIMPVTGMPLPLLILRRVFSAGLVDRHGHVAKRLYLSKGLLIMSDRNFSRRRRGGMRFRPSGGLGHRPAATTPTARPPRPAPKPSAARRRRKRSTSAAMRSEIERAENIAAGLPPEGAPAATTAAATPRAETRIPRTQPAKPPPRSQEEKTFAARPRQGTAQRHRGNHQGRRHQPGQEGSALDQAGKRRSTRKSSSTPRRSKPASPCLEEGKLEEFNIERTTEERLVGSIFKGKVRNLEDGLKAAFVDIGFEKNAFLHYWDIVPSNFDSGVEIVEREGTPARQAQNHAEGYSPRLSAGQRHHRAGDKRARSAPKARASRRTSCCPAVTSCCCRTPTKAAFRARSKTSRNASA